MAETKITSAQTANDVWTSTNLTAGTDISFSQVPQPIIDANTLGVWHFDSNIDNAVSGNNVVLAKYQNNTYTNNAVFGSVTSLYHKFGDGALLDAFPGTFGVSVVRNCTIGATNDFTVDMWIMSTGTRYLSVGCFIYDATTFDPSSNDCPIGINIAPDANASYGKVTVWSNGSKKYYTNTFSTGTWYHFAYERYNGTYNAYWNGNKVWGGTYTRYTVDIKDGNSPVQIRRTSNGGSGDTLIDELRISNVARYQGNNFDPWTQPYTSGGDPIYRVNNTLDISGKQDALTGATGYDATKTQVLKNVNGTLTWVDEA